MTWKVGESGNPHGSRRERLFYGALNRAIVQEDGKRLRESAEQLLDNAAAGEPWAIQMLADRLDGKASQELLGPGEEGEHTMKIIHEAK